ncbi:MAG TPA: OsmC family protein [Myxococcota bacterium]|nr:OsmC family protein [Myxococcota bacterium]HRY95247.1 OsmC family protein [Myxococcota bacterium]HSA22898.1 OsmC family protein [Myxococcota bacterium]
MKVELSLVEGMKFAGRTESGHQITLDASREHGGEDAGARPTELLLLALAGCTAMDVISILRKKKQAVSSFAVEVDGTRAEEHPKRFTRIELTFVVRGRGLDPAAVARAVSLSYDRYCSVRATLQGNPEIVTSQRVEEIG